MRYFLNRLVQFMLVFVVVTFVTMAATRIGSEDPVRDLAGGTVSDAQIEQVLELSLIHISEPTRLVHSSRMPSSA